MRFFAYHTFRAVNALWTDQISAQMSTLIALPNLGTCHETSIRRALDAEMGASFCLPRPFTLGCYLVVCLLTVPLV